MTYVDSPPPTPDACFAALADPTRRKVLEAIIRHPQSVTNIAAHLPVSRPAVSQHLKTLSDAGLVSAQPQGNKRIYHANRAGLHVVRTYLDGLWDDVLNAFADSFEEKDSAK